MYDYFLATALKCIADNLSYFPILDKHEIRITKAFVLQFYCFVPFVKFDVGLEGKKDNCTSPPLFEEWNTFWRPTRVFKKPSLGSFSVSLVKSHCQHLSAFWNGTKLCFNQLLRPLLWLLACLMLRSKGVMNDSFNAASVPMLALLVLVGWAGKAGDRQKRDSE